MKFTPKQLKGNVNVSKTHPLVELCWLLSGFIFVTGVFFVLLGFGAYWAASKAPISVENWLGRQALEYFPAEENRALNEQLSALIDILPRESRLHQYNFRTFLAADDEVNAIALPGGNIIIFSGLVKQVESENELAMILAHELGHFENRDHLQGLGRGLGLTVGSLLLFGENSVVSELVSRALLTFQVRYSQSQESAADRFGLELLVKRYGHAGGSKDFFIRSAKRSGSTILYLMASHPHPEARIEHLEKLIEEYDYPLEATLTLPPELTSALDQISP